MSQMRRTYERWNLRQLRVSDAAIQEDRSVGNEKLRKEDPMEYEIDISRLRRDMKDYYGTAMFNGFPMAVMDLSKVERMSDRDLIELAQKNGVDLRKYIV